jgi:four helix bundle protein
MYHKNMKSNLFDFEKLTVYQKALDFIDEVCKVSENFPAREMFKLTAQFRGAATSIALNIGEGSGGTRKEFIQFLCISRRSVRECVVCTTICYRREYIDQKIFDDFRHRLDELSRMQSGLINYLESPKAKDNSTSHPLNIFGYSTLILPTLNSQLPTRKWQR